MSEETPPEVAEALRQALIAQEEAERRLTEELARLAEENR
ncbi:hypothetical protein GCM10010259_61150 [Streptomyces daghestanicus]|uniref:Uncharacterized protein n=1 Tax=Streptomyces daghestanicus TaxID=66885 RepID=A0ABQ3Q7K8_9ACTN|nr:hypothetical protein GCM10010259_61150 [Streptomyces daghestanicus]GHI33270.1 hypothetical protein Sdagh_50000 [Streptomyces daghestanicus]